MPFGEGKYDEQAQHVRRETAAAMVAVLVFSGMRGTGFSVQAIDPNLLVALPDMLEMMAAEIRATMTKGPAPDGKG